MPIPAQLSHEFRRTYPATSKPRICRAPGRINLIGEHTDYNGLPVLPMAINREIRIAAAPGSDGRIRLRNYDIRFPPAEFTNLPDIPPSPTGSWENYCKAAIQGINRCTRMSAFPGMDLLVAGDIPAAAGLSSSSALVVAVALAYLDILGIELGRALSQIELATVLADAEHYVGTRGGGMDQAIILLGRQDEAAKIDFHPLHVEPVPLPRGLAIVACNSLVKAAKTGDALHRYNEGPITCHLIRALVEKQLQNEFGADIQIERLADLWMGNLCLTDAEVQDLFAKTFPAEYTPLSRAAQTLGLTVPELRQRWLGDLREPPKGFRLQARARHQRTEYQRVEAARDALLAHDAATLGSLMNDSHESCAKDYAVSCPELDHLVLAARRAGALGSRLTGAGFGGCAVNLVPIAQLEAFRERIQNEYYRRYLGKNPDTLPQDTIAVLTASPGASYVDTATG